MVDAPRISHKWIENMSAYGPYLKAFRTRLCRNFEGQ
jgi:hypothetical protein